MSTFDIPTSIDPKQASELLQAITENSGSGTLARGLLQNLKLNDEQMALFDSLLSMNAPRGSDDIDFCAELDMPEQDNDCVDLAAAAGADEELDSLREVNDTVAAALGACKYCWGGNDECAECEGAGSPGSLSPDSELFCELILPAVRRIRVDRK
ncbi:MAG: hypothetical protein OEV41_05765, partial [Gammaproteobacteria bacterium]|nr:hypothetical protein [Gammaproteobacteria bacterium]